MSIQTAVVAAGCFWGVQYYFDQVPGIISTRVGYTGGNVPDPTYDAVCTGKTNHAEALEVQFDPAVISYADVLRQFFRMHNPTLLNRQGPDIGTQYRSAIFYTSPDQQATAIAVRNETQEAIGKPVVTQIDALQQFYVAEPYHQKFTDRTGIGMCHIPYAPLSATTSDS